MRRNPVVREITHFILPAILLFGLYVQFHGDYSPGGGFQAGVLIGAAIIAHGLVQGLERTQRALPPAVVRTGVCLGLFLYVATGFTCLLLGGNFLDYDVLWPHHGAGPNPHGQELGILAVELGVFITVASVMVTIFYGYAARRLARTSVPPAPDTDSPGHTDQGNDSA